MIQAILLYLLFPNREGISPQREREMRKFDPWPIFFRREWNRNWPFLTGFAITGAIIIKMTAGFTEEDFKNSPFAQAHKRNGNWPERQWSRASSGA
ncbi:uncharacterized protein LOC110032697 isoform X2 [Phalaenopsis equestris]|uniref:uncharacterized protein LOC110032697 isoform X2 n=1 Tax=Phalaenopsis equestris TaxID=78828 RepID=UPI0009E42649|nr:uncharacterized protein LOC110032697 isoform X2 [Phalaenopsis equestris]